MASRTVAPALAAVADRLLGPEELVRLISGGTTVVAAGGFEAFARLIRDHYDTASGPLRLAQLAQAVRAELGAEITATKWFGHQNFSKALTAVGLPHSRVEKGFLLNAKPVTTTAPRRAIGTANAAERVA